MSKTEELKRMERLSALVYLDSLEGIGNLGKIVDKMKNTPVDWPCKMTQNEWHKVMDSISRDPYLSALKVLKIEDVKESRSNVKAGHKAVVFGGNAGRAYIVFRGTGSAEEWEDNARGMFLTDTIQQQAAARFVRENHSKHPKIVVAGHSKGGNKAQYVAITEPYVESCYSFDGQGFSPAFMEKYKNEIQKRKQIISLVAERRGFVHALGIPIGPSEHYIGRRGNPRVNLPHGESLLYFHCPDAMRNTASEFGPQSQVNLIPEIIEQLIEHFLISPKYAPYRENTALGLTSFISHQNESKAAEAVSEILIALTDLIATDTTFRHRITELLFKETDVLLASLDAAKANYFHKWSGDLSDMGKKVAHIMAQRLLHDKESRHNFRLVLVHIVKLRRVQLSGMQMKLSGYISKAISIIFKILHGKNL